MRLICGVVQLDGLDADEALLDKMIEQMAVPRLHHALAVWREGKVGLGLLDFSPDGGLATGLPKTADAIMAADVRLDEPETLARALGVNADLAQDGLLMTAFNRHGTTGLGDVLGDFAFAQWDFKAQRLTCARDVFGIRPFFYVHLPGRLFAFASLAKALHGGGIVPKKLDEDAVLRRMVLALRFEDSLVAGIKRLPPAHVLELSGNELSVLPYWRLNREAIGARKISPQEAARELRRLVDQAVKCRLPSGREIGAHLSGGLDSSAISVLAARQLRKEGRKLHAYSFLDRQRNDIVLEDETEFVRSVLDQEGDIDWTPIRPPTVSPGQWPRMDIDKMRALGADFPEAQVCIQAEKQRVTLILAGCGGDEGASFNGRGTFVELFLRGRWLSLAREIGALKSARGDSKSKIFQNQIAAYLIPHSIRNFVRRVGGKPPEIAELISKSFSHEARRRLADADAGGSGRAPDGRKNRRLLMMSPHIAERAEVWAQTGARNGVAYAFPLLDRRVVEFSLSLPSELFLRDGFNRRLFRDAMGDVLPDRVRLRHAKYLPFPSDKIVLAERKDEFVSQIEFIEKNERLRRLFDLTYLRRLIDNFPSPDQAHEEISRSGSPTAMLSMIAVAQALSVAAYLEQHGDDGVDCARADREDD